MRNEKTINQINGFCDRNETLEFYRQIRAEYGKISYDFQPGKPNYRMQYFAFNFGGYSDSHYPMSNFIDLACRTELKRFCGISEVKDFRREHLRIESEKFGFECRLDIQIVLSIEFDGVFIQAVLSDFDFIPSQKFRVRSNETFHSLDILHYFSAEILKKHLFAPGTLRDFQIEYNCSKSEAIAIYKQIKQENAEAQADLIANNKDVWAEKALRRNLKRHYNLKFDSFWSSDEMLRVKNDYGKQKRLTQVSPFPIRDFYGFDSDGDIDEIEANFYETIERENPTIFV